jgi:hypothetical protein
MTLIIQFYFDTGLTMFAATCSSWFLAHEFSTLKMEAIRSSETSVHRRSTRRHIPEGGILHSHLHDENLKSLVYSHYPK